MKQIINYLKALGLTFSIILIAALTLAIFCYYTNIDNGFISFLKLAIPIISIFVSSFILGKKANKKGFIEGLKIALLFIVIVFIISLLVKAKLGLNTFLYYLLIALTSMLVASIGINKKEKRTNPK